MNPDRLRIAVLCPHFAPDTAPTGEVMTRIVAELAALGHEVHVVTALPWYREPRGRSRLGRQVGATGGDAEWGSITRVHPFPGGDKRNLVRRAAGFAGFSALAGLTSLRGGRVDAVIAMSPPLTMGLTGWVTHLVRRGPLVFNIQDVFPDAAIETGAITNRSGHRRWRGGSSGSATAAPPRSPCSATTCATTSPPRSAPSKRHDVRVIPNFVDTDFIRPHDRDDALCAASSASATSRWCCTPATSASRSRWRWSSTRRERCRR